MVKVDWLEPMRPPIDHCPNIPPLRLQDRREVEPPAQDITSPRTLNGDKAPIKAMIFQGPQTYSDY